MIREFTVGEVTLASRVRELPSESSEKLGASMASSREGSSEAARRTGCSWQPAQVTKDSKSPSTARGQVKGIEKANKSSSRVD